MDDYADLDDLDGISRNVLRLPRRFSRDWSTMSVSTASYSTNEDDDDQRIKPRSRPKSKPNQLAKRNGSFAARCVPSLRGTAARDAADHCWTFLRSNRVLSDVDTRKYPYELICGPTGNAGGQQLPSPHCAFLDCFDASYIQAAVDALQGVTVGESMEATAVFGRTRFRLNSLHAGRRYSWSDLRDVQHPVDLQSTWSNVCDLGAPAMRALMDALAELQAKLRLTVRCCLTRGEHTESVNVHYLRSHGQWLYTSSRAFAGLHASHDIILDSVSFRVKVYSQSVTAGNSWWRSVHNLLRLHEAGNGDPFATKATLAGRASKDLKVEYTSVKRDFGVVELYGLRFVRYESLGSMCLKVLPPRRLLDEKNAGESFEFLVKRLVETLDLFGAK